MLILVVLSLLMVVPALAQETARYEIERVSSPLSIDAQLDEAAWKAAKPVGDFHFNSPDPEKQQTVVKLLWDDENLYLAYYMHDRNISAYITERHGPVSKDDCIELFLSPNPEKVSNYYTFEINAIGAMLNRAKTDWWTGSPTWEPDGVKYRASFHGQSKKDPIAGEDHWVVEMAVPLRNFAKDAAHTPPHPGDQWRLNLNRLEGLPTPDSTMERTGLSTWSPRPVEERSFHSPQYFGWVTFVERVAR